MHPQVYPTQAEIKSRWAERAALVEEAASALERLGQRECAEKCRETHAKPVAVAGLRYRLNAFSGEFEPVVCATCGESDLTAVEAERRECMACQRDRYREYEEDFISYHDDVEVEGKEL